jgi:hypothetical protein
MVPFTSTVLVAFLGVSQGLAALVPAHGIVPGSPARAREAPVIGDPIVEREGECLTVLQSLPAY